MVQNNDQKIPWGQKLLDNIWLLLALGILIPSISYTLWGIIEILLMSDAKLP